MGPKDRQAAARLTIVLLFLLARLASSAQEQTNLKKNTRKIGLKAGYNWSYATAGQSGVNLNSKTGYMIGAFLAPQSKGIGFRSEIIYSHQGYSFANGGQNTAVMNDYIYLPQLTTLTIGKILQLQLGGQIGYLLNSEQSSSNAKDSSVTGFMNRFDYGFAGGIELNPVAGFIIGARYNLGLGNLYKHYQETATNPTPFPLPFDPRTTNLKNGVIRIFVGYKF
jgi:outer membrane protein with beta-barrel domain